MRLTALLLLQAGGAAADAGERAEAAAKRIDGGDLRRETLFSGVESRQRNWLSESDVSFFTGGGPGEADGEVSQEEQGVVQVGAADRAEVGGGYGVARAAWAAGGHPGGLTMPPPPRVPCRSAASSLAWWRRWGWARLG